MAKQPTPKSVDAIKHDDAKRKNISTAEYQSVLDEEQKNPRQVRYPRRRVSGVRAIRRFLTLNDRVILRDASRISAELAKTHTEREFEKFRRIDDRAYESGFDRMVKRLPAGKPRMGNV